MGKRLRQAREKTQIQRQARKVLGKCGGKLGALFNAAGQKLGKPWSGGKADGYQLLREVVSRGFEPLPETKRPKLVYRPPQSSLDPVSDEFLLGYEWRRLRMVVLKKRGARCECCGFTAKDGVKIHVDHIKPRRLFPQLALVEDNLQVLCEVCNHGKGNWDQTDWRTSDKPMPPEHYEPFWTRRVN